jgi:two-component system, OmpR family, phosphate regulon sensor histidine kinase PhoR
MFKKLQGTIFLFLIILILPTLIFSIYELGTLRKNEQVIENIYLNQLDAILFSVNQYSEDVMSSWAGKLKSMLFEGGKSKDEIFKNFINEIPVSVSLLQYDKDLKLETRQSKDLSDGPDDETIYNILVRNDSTLRRLQTFLQSGYQKIESFGIPGSPYQLLLFACEFKNETCFNVLIIDPQRFISEILDPKIQEIARDKFDISALKTSNNILVYNSARQFLATEFQHKKPFWLLKGYSMAIELKDQTIADLAKSRSKKDLMLIGTVDLVLFLGIWLIYRNVRKQIELSQLKSDFVSNVSHEIRTPLALISMYIETLEMGRVKTAEKVKEYYNIILQESQRLTDIVNKILNFSQIESGKRAYSFAPVQLNTLVEKVIATFKVRLEKSEFTFATKLAEGLPEIQGDSAAITDALVNLVDNAIKYSNDEKNIEIVTGRTVKYTFIEVTDKGIGISTNELKHIFDKFYRVTEKNLALKAKGSGLGLTIVKHIIDAHQGQIEVESTKGIGSTFRILFLNK